jgi:hypothetical protein
MRKYLFIIFSMLLFTYGCANHYYKSRNDSLYIYLKKPKAESVFFLSSIDGYKYHKAERIDRKTWEVRVPVKKEFKYFYIVDGEPFVPECRYREADDFGSINCVYVPYL